MITDIKTKWIGGTIAEELHLDHGDLAGLADDDHSAYMLDCGTPADNTLIRADGTGGRIMQTSGVIVDNSDNITTTGWLKAAGHILSTTRVTGTTTLGASHHHVFGDTDGGAFTITLPAGVDGTQYRVANVGASGNNLTLAPDGAELLVGANANFDILDGETLDLTYETTEGWIA